MKYSLRTKLSLSYLSVALLCVILISIFTNIFFEKYFKEYVIKNQEQKNNEIVSLVSRQYSTDDKWNVSTIENIGVNALEQGMIIKVIDVKQNTIWDATVHNNGLCKQMIAHMAENMSSRYPNWKGGYVVNKYPVSHDNTNVGVVEVGYYGPYYFDDNDIAFLTTLNNIVIVGVFSLFLALLIGTIMAKRLTTPISRVINTASMISKGYFEDRVNVDSSTKEISQLTDTINNLAETLEKQETLRKRLTADVSHELRTPIATLQSHLEAMIDGIWKPDLERLESCHEEIMRINRMVGDLEKLARYESENLILNKESFDMSELVRRQIQNFEPDYKKKSIDLNFEGKNEEILADKDKVSQVVVNLLSNAMKYTPEGGRVDIRVEGNDDSVKVSVTDSGNGIPEEDLPNIFERFYRADKSRNRLTGGSGIGLTIAKAIVEAHKGKIEVESKVGVGTRFTVTLPRKVE